MESEYYQLFNSFLSCWSLDLNASVNLASKRIEGSLRPMGNRAPFEKTDDESYLRLAQPIYPIRHK
ncbi:unnamed protein product, partial [Nesidiocoris tenuis]